MDNINGDILIVDDILPNLRLLSDMLEGAGYKVRAVSDGQSALRVIGAAPPDLILLDVYMPDMEGYEVCARLKADKSTAEIPIIFISALGEVLDKVKAFDAGGIDYVTMPFQYQEVISRVRNHLEFGRLQKELQALNGELENRVAQRTQEFSRTVAELEEAVAESRHSEEERSSLDRQLHHLQKMEALGRLAGGVAHDLNNVLSVITGYSEIILGESSIDPAVRQPVEQMRLAGERGSSITQQLLAFSRRQVMLPKPLCVNDLIGNLETTLRQLIGEDIEVVTRLEPDLGLVKADAGKIDQVIMNLAVNARDAMPDGGRLTIETAIIDTDRETIGDQSDLVPGRYAAVTVRDTGVGIKPEIRDHIFEPFFTTRPPGVGTGMGLAMVHGIVTQSGGSITVESQLGSGTAFAIYLPSIESAAIDIEPSSAPVAQQHGSETILLVDDEGPIRCMVQTFLKDSGLTVLEASNGSEALQAYRSYTGPIDLLITDVAMPEMGGCELTQRLLAMHPGIKVLYMSGYLDDEGTVEGIMNSEQAFLPKPFTKDDLTAKISEILA